MKEFFNLFILLSLQFSTSTQQPLLQLCLVWWRGSGPEPAACWYCCSLCLFPAWGGRWRWKHSCKRHEESGSCYFNHPQWGKGVLGGHPVTTEGFGPQCWLCDKGRGSKEDEGARLCLLARRQKILGEKKRHVQTLRTVLKYNSKSSRTQVLLLVNGGFIQEWEMDAGVQSPAYFHRWVIAKQQLPRR